MLNYSCFREELGEDPGGSTTLWARIAEMQCRRPHTNVRKGATQFSYKITAIGLIQRVTPEQRGWWGSLEGLDQMLHMVNGPEEGSSNTDLTPGLHQNHLTSIPGSHPQRFGFFRFTEESHNVI